MPRPLIAYLFVSLGCLAAVARAQDAKPLTITGTPDPKFAPLDQAMKSFMEKRSIRAGVLAVQRKGAILFERGYGWRDEALQRPLPVSTRFRIGPLSSVLTNAGVQSLIEAGKLRLDQPVFEILKPRSGDAKPDEHLARITIQRLIEHNAGWDFTETFDPVREPWRLAEELKLAGHPKPEDYVRYAHGLKLTRDPGMQRHDTALDSILLGEVIQQVSGQPYAGFIRDNVLKPLALRDIEPAAMTTEGRRRDEAWYVHSATSRPVFAEASEGEVPGAYGGVHLEHLLASDGWLASARSFALLMEARGATGKRPLAHETWTLQGGLPGSYAVAIWRRDGLRIVAVFNQSADESHEPYDVIARQLDEAATKVARELRN